MYNLKCTPSQKKSLKYHQSFNSYKKHWMKNDMLIIECEFEYKDTMVRYLVSVGKRGGEITYYL